MKEGTQPVNLRPYRYSHLQKDAIERIVTELLQAGVISPDIASHKEHLQIALQVLRENELYAKRSKCTFAASRIEYLGHIISGEGVSTDPDNMESMLAKTQHDQATNGFSRRVAGYSIRFIKGYGVLSRHRPSEEEKL